jgi:flagellar hook-basal body complex protein FliE
MSNLELFGIDKPRPIKPSMSAARSYVKDLDLQVHVPGIGDIKDMEASNSFKGVLGGVLDEVNTLQHEADAQIQKLASGETEDLHEVTMAMDEAETSFQLMMEVRNRLMDAYKELMRMQT